MTLSEIMELLSNGATALSRTSFVAGYLLGRSEAFNQAQRVEYDEIDEYDASLKWEQWAEGQV